MDGNEHELFCEDDSGGDGASVQGTWSEAPASDGLRGARVQPIAKRVLDGDSPGGAVGVDHEAQAYFALHMVALGLGGEDCINAVGGDGIDEGPVFALSDADDFLTFEGVLGPWEAGIEVVSPGVGHGALQGRIDPDRVDGVEGPCDCFGVQAGADCDLEALILLRMPFEKMSVAVVPDSDADAGEFDGVQAFAFDGLHVHAGEGPIEDLGRGSQEAAGVVVVQVAGGVEAAQEKGSPDPCAGLGQGEVRGGSLAGKRCRQQGQQQDGFDESAQARAPLLFCFSVALRQDEGME